MTASPALLLVGYCLAIALASLVGGFLPDRLKMTHTRIQLVMSFVSGLMLAVAFFHLLPHGIAMLGGAAAVDLAVVWLMIGLVVMLLLLRSFHFHQHDFSDAEHSGHEHQAHVQGNRGMSWLGIALGLGVHTLIDGIALGAAMQGDVASHAGGMVGVGVFLAILLHKPLDAMSITSLMAAGGSRPALRHLANAAFALMCPLGALLFYFGVDAAQGQQALIGGALAFSAGAFICIALSDLLPEVHFHSHDRVKLTLAFLAGILLAWAIGGLEPASLHPGGFEG